jgi:alpha-amylase
MRTFWLSLVTVLVCSAALGEENFFHPSVRSAHQGDVIYLVMPDRFFNGDPGNDLGSASVTDPKESGFDPANPEFFHGGDLRGIDTKLDYLNHLGINSIWLTPIFRNRAVQNFGEGTAPMAGYHGYWILDFTNVDPHFGNKEDLQHLIEDAKARKIGTILDVVVNHTADVIQPKNGVHAYQYKFSKPYRDADGKKFDDRDYINRPDFPKLDPDISFPVPPAFLSGADREIKTPDWLNDPTVYHNRGEASTGGESAQYGDISGLDDLFTEQARVVQGMIDIYAEWIRKFPISGFRLDTVKHVNNEFWQKFIPAMSDVAKDANRKNFFIFGEVYDQDPAFLSEFVHRASLASVLDFGFQRAAHGFASGTGSPRYMAEFFEKDSFYITPGGNAYGLVTFLGNHDIGRIGYFLSNDFSEAPAEGLLSRDLLAHALMFFTRGIPSIYYGDEQGFTGRGGDVAAREDMFASKVPEYLAEKRIGGGDPSAAAFNEDHPLFRAIREMATVRRNNPPLQSGIQIVQYAEEKPGILAISRIDRDSREEMLVVLNNSTETRKANVKVLSAAGNWERIYATGSKEISFGPGPDNQISVALGALSVLVLHNAHPIEPGSEQLSALELTAARTSELEDRWEIKAEIASGVLPSIAFGVRAKGETEYKFLGTADSPPFRVFPPREIVPNAPELEFKAIGRDLFGKEITADFDWHRPVLKRH